MTGTKSAAGAWAPAKDGASAVVASSNSVIRTVAVACTYRSIEALLRLGGFAQCDPDPTDSMILPARPVPLPIVHGRT